jgi:hypothetical protein
MEYLTEFFNTNPIANLLAGMTGNTPTISTNLGKTRIVPPWQANFKFVATQ